MNDLEMYREQLALCDDKIIDALVERNFIIEKIMAYKEEYGMPILQPHQEEKQKRRLEEKHGIKRGDVIQIIQTSYASGDGKIITKKVKARIKALYPHVVQLQLPNGITRSPTYWELERLKAGGGTDGQGHSGTIPGDKGGNP